METCRVDRYSFAWQTGACRRFSATPYTRPPARRNRLQPQVRHRMGKQITFYMDSSDEAEFLTFARSDRRVAICAADMPTEQALVFDELPGPIVAGWFIVWLRDLDHSPEPRAVRLPGDRGYSLDGAASEVIEFQRSFLDRGRLVSGRLWTQLHALLPSSAGRELDYYKKSIVLEQWFDRLAA